jgi:molybdopterin-guanine dinucleotide biosynthesis protein A
MELEVFILAGGKSSRMGTDKGIISFNGKSMVQYSIDLANHLSERVTIISNNMAYKDFGFPVVKDILPNIGPIGGVYTALKMSKAHNVLVLTVDSPMLQLELIHELINAHLQNDVTYLLGPNRIYPLTAIYNKTSLAVIKMQIEQGNFTVRDCFNNLHCGSVELRASQVNQLANINTLLDLKKYESNS